MQTRALSARRAGVWRFAGVIVTFGVAALFVAILFAGSALAAVMVSTVAGSPGKAGTANGTGNLARFNLPQAVCFDPDTGALYVADTASNTIRKVTTSGVVTTLAGVAGAAGEVNGTGAAARFNGPSSICYDSSDHFLYVTDTGGNTIRRVTTAGVVTTIATGLHGPTGICYNASDDGLYFLDSENSTVCRLFTSGQTIVIAGSPGQYGSADGTGSRARFRYPKAICYDSDDHNLYVADSGNHTIRRVTTAGVVTTIAGYPGVLGSTNGTGGLARFFEPRGICYDSRNHYLYVADTGNALIRRVTVVGTVTTAAGTAGVGGFADGATTVAVFLSPYGIGFDSAAGDLYVADTYNDVIRRIGLGLVPSVQSLSPSSGPASGGNTVTINGFFQGVTGVTFGSLPATNLVVKSTQITCTAPATVIAGKIEVRVSALGNISDDYTTGNDYTYRPIITSMSSSRGPAAGGNKVTVKGVGFRYATAVRFGGTTAGDFVWVSDTQVTCTVPLHAAGVVTVAVVGNGNISSVANAHSYYFYYNAYEQNASAMLYSPGWTTFPTTAAQASGGSYVATNAVNTYVTIPFFGTRIDWTATKGLVQGKADVWLDGAFKGTVDLYSGSLLYRQVVYSSGTLARGYHRLQIERNPTNAAGAYINLDTVQVGGTLVGPTTYQETDPNLHFFYGWAIASSIFASGGTYAATASSNGELDFYFDGLRFTLASRKAPSYGKAYIYVDDVALGLVDLYAVSSTFADVWTSPWLKPGHHLVKIKVAGSHTYPSTGYAISVDAIKVWGALSSSP